MITRLFVGSAIGGVIFVTTASAGFTAEGSGFGMSTEDLKIWFGIPALIVVELGLITPPVGMNVFVISALAKDIPMAETFKGVVPFFGAEVIQVAALAAFPAISLWLPRVLGVGPTGARR